MGKMWTIAQEAIGLIWEHNFWLEGFLGFEPRIVMLKVKFRLSRGEI